MRRSLLQFASVLILVICFGSCVSETFDHWDHTMQTGQDIESELIVLALVTGAAVILTRIVLSAAVCIYVASHNFAANAESSPLPLVAACGPSPPLSLRI